MNTAEITQKKVTVTDFKAHCTEYLREVESGSHEFIITKHGKIIAIAKAPQKKIVNNAFVGAGIGTAELSKNYDPEAPAFAPDEWEMNAD